MSPRLKHPVVFFDRAEWPKEAQDVNAVRVGRWGDYAKFADVPCGVDSCEKTTRIALKRLTKTAQFKCVTHRLRKRPFESVYNRLVRSAKERGYQVSLTYKDYSLFAQITSCHYCDAELHWLVYSTFKGTGQYGHNIDRKDNDKGYSVANCVTCCEMCNRVKGDKLSYDEMMLLRPGLVEISKRRRNV